VLVDGRPVNGCALLTARHGRGQKILTVAGIATGPGPQGLHPLQRAFWLEGGFQCGICTRGFVMSAYALLQKNANPTTGQIKEALAGNICRCGEYTKILSAVQKAAAEMRGEKVTYRAPLITDEPVGVATTAAGSATRQFEFATPLGTIEQFDELSLELKQRPGILDVSGSERTITPVWDPARLDEARVRQILAEAGHPVRP
jgi:aerobic-type carbon monoxide dehydrogenase small subunit (CoxS/CutS family)